MTTEPLIIDHEGFRSATRKGLIAAVFLGVLTAIEFFIATTI